MRRGHHAGAREQRAGPDAHDAGASAGAAPARAPVVRAAASERAEPPPTGSPMQCRAGPRLRRVALVGTSNVGKSVVFGALTGTHATGSNYPGTTVEVARAPARFDRALEMIDTPGVNGLIPDSEDERVTRDILLDGVDAVLVVADGKNLRRGLAVALQVAETGLPFVVLVNMIDEAADRGLAIDASALSLALGVPVLPTVAVRGAGLAAVPDALRGARSSPFRVRYPPDVEAGLLRTQRLLSGGRVAPRALALMALAGDATLGAWLRARLPDAAVAALEERTREVQAHLHRRVAYELARARIAAAETLARAVTSRVTPSVTPAALAPAQCAAVALAGLAASLALFAADLGILPAFAGGPARLGTWLVLGAVGLAAVRVAALRVALGRWATQRRAGVAVLFVVLYVAYRFVGVFAAGSGVDFLEHRVFGAWINPLVTRAADGALAAIAPGAGGWAPALAIVRDLLVGPYGLVTVALTYAFAIILPIVSAFFVAFAVLEDSGYLPRLAVVVHRGFQRMGLNGKAVLPMVLGLGCDTMATLTARIMETRKERILVTLLLALGVPCSAQLGVILGLLGALPLWAPFVWGGVVLSVLFAVGFVAARVLPGERSDLMLELPPIRCPHPANVALKTIGRLQWYLEEAVPIFVLGTFVLFVLDATGALARVVRASEPAVIGVLQLPPQAAEAFLVGFFRRDYGSAGIYVLFQHGALSPVQAVVALVTITLFVPCVANFFVIVHEHGVRTACAIAGFIFPFAFAVGGVVNVGLRVMGLS